MDPIIATLDWSQYAGAVDKYKTSKKTAQDRDAALKDAAFGTVLWSLGSNGKDDAGVLAHMEEIFSDPATSKTRKMWLGVILSKIKPEKYKLERSGAKPGTS